MSTCQHRNSTFSRDICPEPCGVMHTSCDDCGETLEGCAHNHMDQESVRDWRLEVSVIATQLEADAVQYGHKMAEADRRVSTDTQSSAFWFARQRDANFYAARLRAVLARASR